MSYQMKWQTNKFSVKIVFQKIKEFHATKVTKYLTLIFVDLEAL